MTSAELSNKEKTKLSDFLNIFIWSLKKHKALGIVYVSLLVFSSPVIGLLASLSIGTLNNPVTAFTFASLSTVVTMIMTFIISVMMFDYLHNKRQADVFGSLPCTRRTLFFSRFTTGLAMIIVPYIINMLIVILMSFGLNVGSDIFTIYIPYIFQTGTLVMLSVIASYSFTAFMAVCCGTTANTVLSTLLICFAYPIAISMLSILGSSMIPGVNLHIGEFPLISNLLSPYGSSAGGIFSLTLSVLSFKYTSLDFLSNNWQQLVAWAILIAASIVGCFFLTKKRKTEAAQNSFAFKAPSVIIRFIATAAVGMLFGLIFTFSIGLKNVISDFENMESIRQTLQHSAWTMLAIFLIAFVIAAFLTHLIATVIFNKGFKGFAKSLISFAAVVLCVCLLYTSLAFGGFGADKYVPQADKVSSVEITPTNHSGYWFEKTISSMFPLLTPQRPSSSFDYDNDIICAGEESINAAAALHQKIIDNLNNVNPMPYSVNTFGDPYPFSRDAILDYNGNETSYSNPYVLKFLYRMKDGTTVERIYPDSYYYNINIDNELQRISIISTASNLDELSSLLNGENGAVTMVTLKSDWYGSIGNQISKKGQKKLLDELGKALLKDIESGNDISKDSKLFCKTVITYKKHGSSTEDKMNFNIPMSYKNTVKLLSQYGYTTSLNLLSDSLTAAASDLSSCFIDYKTGELSKEAVELFFTLPDNISNDYLEDRTTKESDNSCPQIDYDMTFDGHYNIDEDNYTEEQLIDRSKLRFKVVYSDSEGNLYYYNKESSITDFAEDDRYGMLLSNLRDKNDDSKVYYPFVVQAYSEDEKLYTMPVNVTEKSTINYLGINSKATIQGTDYVFLFAG